ncbi:insulin isoform X2 [Linepithema humile]|uniref:insulin isoform X2 n=1 Tax=Linepithema humile TaxID=83485 RepID=UPI00351F4153
MTARGNCATRRALSMLLIATILLVALCAASAQNFKKSHIRMQKLCSRHLSDALYIVCRGRGYNGPFPNSDEDETEVDPTGPGLVEECCYHRCTYETLERYCRPLPKDKQVDPGEAIIEESFILKLPYSVSTTKELSAEQRSQTEADNADDAIKHFTRQH